MRKAGNTWDEIGAVFGTSGENVRAWAKKQPWFDEIREEHKVTNANRPKEEIEYDGTKGTKTVTTLVELFDEADKTPEKVMEMLGYKLGVWDMQRMNLTKYGKEDSPMYAARLEMKPDKIGIDWDELGERLADKITPREIKINYIPEKVDKYLAFNLFDPHFGQNTLTDYDSTLGKIFHHLENNEFKKLLLVSGGDLLHVDNFNSTTTKGTQLETTDLTQGWEDAFDFLDLIIDKALNSAEENELLYVPGNHDETTGHTIMKALEKVYQKEDRLKIDSEQEMYKATLLGHNFIGATHGLKKNKKDYPMIYATQFSTLWGKEGVFTREALTGHFHSEHVVDINGFLIRQNPTRGKTDRWHRNNGFVGNHKRFLMVEYDEYEPDGFEYV